MFEEINRNITRFAQLEEQELQIFNSLLEQVTIPKKTLLLREGEICRFEAYIVKGLIKSYFIDENGSERILTLACEDWWVSDVSSFCEQQPGRMYIETLEDSLLLQLNPRSKETLLQKVPIMERVFRLMLQRHLSSYQYRLYANIAIPAMDRYLAFAEKNPALLQRIPQHLIASYLGITPEFLSRIRKKIAGS